MSKVSLRKQNIFFPYRVLATSIFILQHKVKSDWLEAMRIANVQRISRGLKKNLLKNKYESGPVLDVDRRTGLTDTEFVSEYLNQGRPVIFEGEAASWACTQKWNLDYFGNAFAGEQFSLIDSTGLVEENFDKSNKNQTPVLIDKMTAKEFVASIRKGEKNYLRFCPIMETHPELANDLDKSWLKRFRRCFLGISYQSFIGPAGRTTPLHSETTAFFYIMADGEKKWTLYSPDAFPLINPSPEGRGYNYSKVRTAEPDLQRYPGFDLLTKYVCHLKKGDILFVPAWMWHEVENTTEGWGLSYRFTSLRGFLRHPTFVFVRLFLTKPSFWEIFYYSFFRKDIAQRDKNLLTPRIFMDE